jgi:uncharacterized membrane protein YfcA
MDGHAGLMLFGAGLVGGSVTTIVGGASLITFPALLAGPPTLVMMAGATVGGFLGGRLARVLPPDLVRWIVITVGTILTAVYAWRYWLR